MSKPERTIKEPYYTARTLAAQTGLSLSTVYRRKRKGYSDLQIIKEAKIMKDHATAGSNWKKVATKTEKYDPDLETEWTGQTVPNNQVDVFKERKRVLHWEPADDYGEVSRLKVLGGWIVKVESEVLFVRDPKHKWEV